MASHEEEKRQVIVYRLAVDLARQGVVLKPHPQNAGELRIDVSEGLITPNQLAMARHYQNDLLYLLEQPRMRHNLKAVRQEFFMNE